MTFRKAEYIKDFSEKVLTVEFDLAAVGRMSGDDAVKVNSEQLLFNW